MNSNRAAEQDKLIARLRTGELRFVFLDPDGTMPEWLGVVIRWPTGVVYGHQCGGTSNLQRLVEGYMIPIGGAASDPESGKIRTAELTALFHGKRHACWYGSNGLDLSAERMERLRQAVSSVPCWRSGVEETEERSPLEIDESRLDELVEAWIPVLTSHGPGILVYPNCD